MVVKVDWERELAIRELADALRQSGVSIDFVQALAIEIRAKDDLETKSTASACELDQWLVKMKGQTRHGPQDPARAILFIEVGDFYYAFFGDAEVVSRLLRIPVKTRQIKAEAAVPLVEIARHAAAACFQKLTEAGYNLKLIEDVKTANGDSRSYGRYLAASSPVTPRLSRSGPRTGA